eukprot:5603975-Pyramimonas_sp.AAC.1
MKPKALLEKVRGHAHFDFEGLAKLGEKKLMDTIDRAMKGAEEEADLDDAGTAEVTAAIGAMGSAA